MSDEMGKPLYGYGTDRLTVQEAPVGWSVAVAATQEGFEQGWIEGSVATFKALGGMSPWGALRIWWLMRKRWGSSAQQLRRSRNESK